jgi:hypothetical protein
MSSTLYSNSAPWHTVLSAATDGHDRCTHLPRRRTGKGIKVNYTYTLNTCRCSCADAIQCNLPGSRSQLAPFLLLLAVQSQGGACLSQQYRQQSYLGA